MGVKNILYSCKHSWSRKGKQMRSVQSTWCSHFPLSLSFLWAKVSLLDLECEIRKEETQTRIDTARRDSNQDRYINACWWIQKVHGQSVCRLPRMCCPDGLIQSRGTGMRYPWKSKSNHLQCTGSEHMHRCGAGIVSQTYI